MQAVAQIDPRSLLRPVTPGAGGSDRDRDRVEPIDFHKYFKAQNEKLLMRQASLWRPHKLRGLRTTMYYEGHQGLRPRAGGLGYEIVPVNLRGREQRIYIINKLRPYSDTFTGLWVQSSPVVEFGALEPDNSRRRRKQRAIRTTNEYLNHLHFTQMFSELCAKYGQFTGGYCAELFFDADAGNGLEWVEEYQNIEVPGEMQYRCLLPDCGATGPMPENGICQDCGSPDVEPVNMPGAQAQQLGKTGWEKRGEIACKFSSPFNHLYSLTEGPQMSPWRYVGEDFSKERVEALYGRLPGNATQKEWITRDDLDCERLIRRAERQRIGSGGSSNEEDDDCVKLQRFWYEPEMLHYIAPNQPVEYDGGVVPPGTRLSEAFPQGMCVLTVPGADRFLRIYPESHKRRFVDGIFGLTPGKVLGHGIEDTYQEQRHYNHLYSARVFHLLKTLQPSIVANADVFTDESVFNRVDPVIRVDPTQIPPTQNLLQQYGVIAMPPVSPDAMAIMEELNAAMQQATKAFTTQSDYPGQRNPTATAARIGADREASGSALHLALYAGFLKEIGIRRLHLAQQHYGELRLLAALNPRTVERDVTEIKKADIEGEFIAWVKPNSWIPNLTTQKREGYQEAIQMLSVLRQQQIDTPQAIRQLEDIYQVDLGYERRNEMEDRCLEELETMQAALAQVGQMAGLIDPAMMGMQIAALCPVDPYELGHENAIQFWREWLTGEGRGAEEVLRAAVRALIDQRMAAMVLERNTIAGIATIGAGMVAPPEATGMGDKTGGQPAEESPGEKNNGKAKADQNSARRTGSGEK